MDEYEDEEEEQSSYLMQEELMHEMKYREGLTPYKRAKYARQEAALLRRDQESQIPIRYRILESGLPPAAQARALKKYQTLAVLEDPTQFCKLRTWLEGLLRIPFGKHHAAPCKSHRSKVKRLCDTKATMDRWIYGHAEAKESIVHMVSQTLANPHGMPQSIGIIGPMGNGKTTLVRQGIAKALQRPFMQISLGGVSDATLLKGHAYTYENSSWGRMVDVLMEARCMNPVVYFDELDKVSQSDKGDEIISALIHMTDTSQNTDFRDHFFEDISIDLSKVVFIFSFNNEKAISPVLLDRLYLIRTQALQPADKCVIASSYLLPTVARNIGFTPDQLRLAPDAARFLISQIPSEKGVRQLKRALEHIVLRLNTMKLLNEACRKRTKKADIGQILGTIQCPAAAKLTHVLHFPLTLTPELLRQLVHPKPSPSYEFMYT